MKTLIERDGPEFELPRGHTLDIYNGSTANVAVGAPGGGGSLFTVREIEERGDAVVVHLGDEMGRSGPATFGHVVPEVTGYPFPSG